MDQRERRCENCGHRNPPTAEFCSECGVFLANVAASGLARVQQTQFTLPDYLLVAREREREERRRRLAMGSEEGVGLVWIGATASVLALWFGGGIGIGAPIFVLGVMTLLFGLWRLRGNAQTLARVGTATTVVSSVVLAAALVQTLGFTGGKVVEPSHSIARPEPTVDPAEAPELAASEGFVPMYRGNAARTGQNPGPAPLTRPAVKWKTFVGGESYASPVVGLGKVFVATKAGSLIALGLAEGEERWRANIGEYIARGTPALDNETLYVATGYTLVALDAQTGRQRWREPLRFAGSCSPVVVGDQLIVATQEGHVSAFKTETGEEIWHYRNDNLLFGSPAVADGVVVIADEAGVVTALNAATGREEWQEQAGGEVFATPAIGGDTVYVATSKPSLVALGLATGAERWRESIGGESSPATRGDVVYLGGDDQAVRAIDAADGDVKWSSPLGYAIQSSATIGGGAVFIASGPTINAVDASDGHVLWTHVTGGDITADLAVVDSTVIASSHDGYVYALASNDDRPAAARVAKST